MSVRQYLHILAVVVILASGQLLFRKAAVQAPLLDRVVGMLSLAASPVFLVALALYGVATLLWVGVLQQVPLSRAYPFMALGFAVVPLAAIVTAGETPSLRFFAGLTFVLVGLLTIGSEG